MMCSGGIDTSGWVSIGWALGSVDSAEVGLMICGCDGTGVFCVVKLGCEVSLGDGNEALIVLRWS